LKATDEALGILLWDSRFNSWAS